MLPPRIDSPTRSSLSTNSRPIRLLASRASFHFLWWGIAFIKRLAKSVSLAKDTLGGSCRNSACLDHPVIKFFGVFSRPAMWVFHPLGRVATEIRAPHPRRVQGVIDVLAPLTILIAPLFQHLLEAEANGIEKFDLYEWTKKTIDDPAKKSKYTKSFALYVGGDEVYEKDKADALEAELKPLVGGPIVAKMFKYNTDPAHNPQPPRQT